MAEGVEAGVLAEDDRIGSADHEVFDGGVGEGVPVVTSITDGAVAELGIRVAVQSEASLDTCDQERGVVEAVAGCQVEFFLWRHGRELGICGHGAKVGHDAQNALGLLGAIGVGSGRSLLGWGRLAGLRRGLEECARGVRKAGFEAGRRSGGNEFLGGKRGIQTDSQRGSNGDTCQGKS